jgi:hypothetical protein
VSDRRQKEVDALINTSLCPERHTRAPLFFHRKIEQSLRFVAIRDAETQKFRYSVAGLFVSLLALPLLAGALVVLITWGVAINNSFPGLRGQFDYYLASVGIPTQYVTNEVLLLVGLGVICVAFFLGMITLRKRIIDL